jgi:hypothetical protein
MTLRFIGAALCGVLPVLATPTSGFARMGGHSPPASASSRDIAEHVTVRAEGLYAKCKEQYGVWPETRIVRAPTP